MDEQELIQWILEGDPAIEYKARKELLYESAESLAMLQRSLIMKEGYIKRYLERRDQETALWANGYYLPKWTSTHYTLLELKNLGCPGDHLAFRQSALVLADNIWYNHGLILKDRYVDLCVAAMMGSIMCHGKLKDPRIHEIMDYILEHRQDDGGFNCSWQRSEKSSIHTTLTVLQLFLDYEQNGYDYRLDEIQEIRLPGEEWLLDHELYRKRGKDEPIHKSMINMPYPTRWKFDFLKGLEYFVDRGCKYDNRMAPAIDLLMNKRLKTGAWPSTGNHQGQIYFKIQDEGRDHRMNTLRALKVLAAYGQVK